MATFQNKSKKPAEKACVTKLQAKRIKQILKHAEVLDKKLQDIKINGNNTNGAADSVSVLKEEGSRTQYAPQVRILKRQTDPSEHAKSNKAKSQPAQQKTLQQREAEYMEARMRIMGEEYSGGDNNCNNSAITPQETRPLKLAKQSAEAQKLQSGKVQILREPKGPDGTIGFDQRR